jgi:outer membrane protein assembly factor BamD (BamD/ComL family)
MEAYYNIGTIYDEKLNDQKEAAKNYETMLVRFAGSEYEPEILYRLYKIYTKLKQRPRAEEKRNLLITKYPESPYALILQNKSVSSPETDANREVTALYEAMYHLYTQGLFEQVKQKKLEADRKFPGNAIRAKFDLLNALAIGKTEPRENFKTALTSIAKEYAKTDVGDHAQNILNYMKKQETAGVPDTVKVIEPDFVVEGPGPYYYILAIKNDKTDFNELNGRINTYNEQYHQFDNLRANNLVSNDGYQLLMVREFADYAKATAYFRDVEMIKLVDKKLEVKSPYLHFVISQNNFKKMYKDQKTDSYYKLFRETYKPEAPKSETRQATPSESQMPGNPDEPR